MNGLLTDYAQNKLTDALLRAQSLGAPATLYFGLLKSTKGARANSTAYALNDTLNVTASDGKIHLYKVTTAGTSAANNTQVIKARGVAPSTPATQPEADTKASTPAPSAPETSPITIGGDPAIGDDEPKDVVGIVAKAGLKMDDLVAEFEKSGDLSDEQYKALQGVRKNLGRDDLRLIAEGWAAKQAAGKAAQMAIRAELASVAGSAAQMNQILVDIKGKLTPAEEAAYNKMLADPVTAKPAFQALMQIRKERMGAGGSSDPITPKSSSAAGSIAPLTDRAAINAATNDPRYAPSIRGMPNPKHDPGYRQQVLEAIAAGRGQTP